MQINVFYIILLQKLSNIACIGQFDTISIFLL